MRRSGWKRMTVGALAVSAVSLALAGCAGGGQTGESSLDGERVEQTEGLGEEKIGGGENQGKDQLARILEKGEIVGTVVYYLNGEVFDLYPIYIEEDSPVIDYPWCLRQIIERWITVR